MFLYHKVEPPQYPKQASASGLRVLLGGGGWTAARPSANPQARHTSPRVRGGAGEAGPEDLVAGRVLLDVGGHLHPPVHSGRAGGRPGGGGERPVLCLPVLWRPVGFTLEMHFADRHALVVQMVEDGSGGK